MKSYLQNQTHIVRIENVFSREGDKNWFSTRFDTGAFTFPIYINYLSLGIRTADKTLFADDTTVSVFGNYIAESIEKI